MKRNERGSFIELKIGKLREKNKIVHFRKVFFLQGINENIKIENSLFDKKRKPLRKLQKMVLRRSDFGDLTI